MADKGTVSHSSPTKQSVNAHPRPASAREPAGPAAGSAPRTVANVSSARPADILTLQRRYGNQAVQRLLDGHHVQAKLQVGPAGDAYEQEADRVADQVMSPSAEALPSTRRVQRQPEEDEIQTRREDPQAGFEAGGHVEDALRGQQGGGSPLPDNVRAYMEPRFGADFSGVRVHTGGQASLLNRQLSARAFTHGKDIYLGEGKYGPGSGDGQRLLAHELTHVVQQTGRGNWPSTADVRRVFSRNRLPAVTVQRAFTPGKASAHQRGMAWAGQQLQNVVDVDKPRLDYVGEKTMGFARGQVREIRDTDMPRIGAMLKGGAYGIPKRVYEAIAPEPLKPGEQVGRLQKFWRGVRHVFAAAAAGAVWLVTAPAALAAAGVGAVGATATRLLLAGGAAGGGKLVQGVGLAAAATGRGIAAGTVAAGAKLSQLGKKRGPLSEVEPGAVGRPGGQARTLDEGQQERLQELMEDMSAEEVAEAMHGHGPPASRSAAELRELTATDVAASMSPAGSSQTASAKVLSAGVDERVQTLLSAFQEGGNRITMFNWVALALSGEGAADVAASFETAAGHSLASDIDRVFGGYHKYSGQYLHSLLKNDGAAPVEMEAALAMGLVTATATDERRVAELMERASPTDFTRAWNLLKNDVRAECGERTYNRLESVHAMHQARTVAEAAAPSEKHDSEQKLAETQAKHLGDLVASYGKRAGRFRGVDMAPLVADLKAWRASASATAVALVQRPGSAFIVAVDNLPRGWFGGMNELDRKYLRDLAGGELPVADASLAPDAATLAAADLKAAIERFGQRGWFGRKFKEGKHGTLLAQFNRLTDEERDRLLVQYDPNTVVHSRPTPVDREAAVAALEKALRQANLDDDEIAAIKGKLTAGKATGATYQALRQLAWSGKLSSLKRIFTNTSFSEAALALVQQLKPEEYPQVRQDQELLGRVRQRCLSTTLKVQGSGAEHWKQIAEILTISEAGTAAAPARDERAEVEGQAQHWATLIGLEIGGRTHSVNVNQLYLVIHQAQQAAGRYAAGDEPKFMQAIYDKLSDAHVKYIDGDAAARKALRENTPIPASFMLTRASGQDAWYRWKDRQAMYRLLEGLEGKELLREWSNIDLFQAASRRQDEVVQAWSTLAAERERQRERAEQAEALGQAEAQSQVKQADEKLARLTAELGSLYTAKSTFVLGINEARRRQLDAALSVNDRVSFEQMAMERLLRAADSDAEFKKGMADSTLDFDGWMRARMKGVKALEAQRQLDTTIQWNRFSSKGAQLDAATRGVVGAARSGYRAIRAAEQPSPTRTAESIAAVKAAHAERTEKALSERDVIEARFRDIQAKFKSRAGLVVQLVVAAALAAVIAGVTFGAGLTLSPLIVAGITAGLSAIKDLGMALYQYKVEGKPLKQVIASALVAVFADAVSVATLGAGQALEAAFLGTSLAAHAWLAPALGQALSKAASSLVTGVPDILVKRFVDQKPIEQAIHEGEGVKSAMIVKVGKSLALDWTMPFILNYATSISVPAPTGGGKPAMPTGLTPEQQAMWRAQSGQETSGTGFAERFAQVQQSSAKYAWLSPAVATAAPALVAAALDMKSTAMFGAEQLAVEWQQERERVRQSA